MATPAPAGRDAKEIFEIGIWAIIAYIIVLVAYSGIVGQAVTLNLYPSVLAEDRVTPLVLGAVAYGLLFMFKYTPKLEVLRGEGIIPAIINGIIAGFALAVAVWLVIGGILDAIVNAVVANADLTNVVVLYIITLVKTGIAIPAIGYIASFFTAE